jgi:hypothetical protein
MTVVRRTIRSIPERSAITTWEIIVDLIAPSKGAARNELESITGIASSLITEETMTKAPIIVYGAGPRLRVYCLFNEDAVTGDKASESSLNFVATDGDWKLSFPATSADLTWVNKALKEKSSRITARDQDESLEESDSDKSESKAVKIDKEAFLRL